MNDLYFEELETCDNLFDRVDAKYGAGEECVFKKCCEKYKKKKKKHCKKCPRK